MVDFENLIDYFKNTPIPNNMLERGQMVLNNNLKPIKVLFEQKSMPKKGWSDNQIEFLLHILSNMDTDKDDKASRVGEREARIASSLHLNTSAGFCHGIGRSGFLTAPQPKAPGGSIMYELTNYLASNFLKKFGLPNIKKAIIVPLCTGMSLALCLGALKPKKKTTIIVPQIDHKSLIKSIDLMGIRQKTVPGKIFGDAVRIPMEDIKNNLDDECFGVISLTSFFPPRENDEIKEISKFAKENDLIHIVINAYGVQSPEWMKFIRAGIDAGRIDVIIQSTDKNILTPVGGAILASPDEDTIDAISQAYAGRASATPVVNALISMLSLGIEGYQKLLDDQSKNRELLKNLLENVATKLNEKILDVFNPVAVAMTLNKLKNDQLFALGGALYNLRVRGPRVYNPSENVFGTCCSTYKTPYIVMNAAIGASEDDIKNAVERFEKAYSQIIQK